MGPIVAIVGHQHPKFILNFVSGMSYVNYVLFKLAKKCHAYTRTNSTLPKPPIPKVAMTSN